MLRRLFLLVSGLSLLCCVATVVLWVRSYWRADYMVCSSAVAAGTDTYYPQELRRLELFSTCGQVEMGKERRPMTSVDDVEMSKERLWEVESSPTPLAPPIRGHFRFGFFYHASAANVGYGFERRIVLVFPYWPLALLTVILPVTGGAICTNSARFARRSAQGLCTRCGYDLRATARRCPECGAEAKM